MTTYVHDLMLILHMQLRSLDFSGTSVNDTLPGDWPTLPKLTSVNLSRTAISGPLPLALLVPSNDTTSTAVPATRLTIDITGVNHTGPATTQLCAPFNISNPLAPLPHHIIAHGKPAQLPICAAYVSWRITLPANASCALAELCGTASPAPSLSQRAQQASDGNMIVAQLACTAVCNTPGTGKSREEYHYSHVRLVKQPRYIASGASAAAGVEVVVATFRRRLHVVGGLQAGPHAGARRLLRIRGAANAQHTRSILQTSAPGAASGGAVQPQVEMATLGLPASPAAARDLLSNLFSDVLSPEHIAGAVATTGDSSVFEVAPLPPSPIPAPAPAPAADPPAQSPAPAPAAQSATAAPRASPGGAEEPVSDDSGSDGDGGVTAVDASADDDMSEDKSLPVAIVAILVVTACVVVLVVGFTAWRSQVCTCDQDLFSVASSKPADYLAAGFGCSTSRAPSDPRYGDLEPESEEDRIGYPQLSASMSFSNLREVVSDTGQGVRRPMWMNVDASGSLRNLFGRSNSSARLGSGGDSRSPAGTGGSGSGGTGAAASGSTRLAGSSASGRGNEKGRFFAEFGKGSPAKALLKGNGSAALLPSPRPSGKTGSSLRTSYEQSASDKV